MDRPPSQAQTFVESSWFDFLVDAASLGTPMEAFSLIGGNLFDPKFSSSRRFETPPIWLLSFNVDEEAILVGNVSMYFEDKYNFEFLELMVGEENTALPFCSALKASSND